MSDFLTVDASVLGLSSVPGSNGKHFLAIFRCHVRRHSSACADIVVLRSPPPIPFPDLKHVYSRSVLFEIEIPCILLFLNRNKNSPKRMHP